MAAVNGDEPYSIMNSDVIEGAEERPESGATEAADETRCRGCEHVFASEERAGFAGLRRVTCPACGKRTYRPQTRGWRAFWWVFAGVTSVGVVFGNVLLLNGYSWIPGGVGVLAFVVLCIDVVLQGRTYQRGVAPARVAVLSVIMTLVAVASIGGALAATGLSNGYSYEVVLQERQSATTSAGYGPAVDLPRRVIGPSWASGSGEQICDGGGDYRQCLAMHIGMYNSVCVADLTASARDTCDDLLDFIDQAKVTLEGCGSGCETRVGDSGLWGWEYLRPIPEQVSLTNKDWRPEVATTEYCDFELGPVQIGSCLTEEERARLQTDSDE